MNCMLYELYFNKTVEKSDNKFKTNPMYFKAVFMALEFSLENYIHSYSDNFMLFSFLSLSLGQLIKLNLFI